MPYWSKDAEAKIVLMDYIAAVTDETSESFIPVADLIAVIDLDGTLMCETYRHHLHAGRLRHHLWRRRE